MQNRLPFYVLDSADSTNSELRDFLLVVASFVVTLQQEAGRGRMGKWHSPENGNLI